MNFLSKCLLLGIVCLLILSLSACSSDSNGSDTLADDPNLQIILPDNVDVMAGGEFRFRLSGDGTLQTSDRIILESAEGISYVCSPCISLPRASVWYLPFFFQKLRSDAGTLERTDFKLTKVEGQDNFNLFVLGDMHLANRTNDDDQFLDFCKDLNAMRQSMTDQRTYALTLGDMTWDLYWYKNHYALPEYLSTMNAQFKNLQVFYTIGNHDNDYKTTSDAEAEGIYRSLIAPTYYSFNIGKVHFVVLDNIDCDAYDGTTDRNYKKSLSAQQLTWLEKDLKYVAINTPFIMAMHAHKYIIHKPMVHTRSTTMR